MAATKKLPIWSSFSVLFAVSENGNAEIEVEGKTLSSFERTKPQKVKFLFQDLMTANPQLSGDFFTSTESS